MVLSVQREGVSTGIILRDVVSSLKTSKFQHVLFKLVEAARLMGQPLRKAVIVKATTTEGSDCEGNHYGRQ